mgnify:CR=1 FL=1
MAQAQVRHANLAWIFQELLTAIVRLKFNRQQVPSSDAFRANMRELVKMAANNAQAAGYSRENVTMVCFAAVAFLDETVLQSGNPIFSNWSGKPLQEELFGLHLAGNAYFDNVQALLGRQDSAEVADMLEIFLLCLELGYRGRYGVASPGELQAVMNAIREKMYRSRGKSSSLSPAWAVPQDMIAAKGPDPKRGLFLGLAIGAAVLAILTFGAGKAALMSGGSTIQSLASSGSK